MEETIRWVPVSEPPDDEITVLLWSDGLAWPAYQEGGTWYWDDGMEVTSFPTHWADMPEGPKE